MSWTNLTLRQKSLDRAFGKRRVALDNSDVCLCRVISIIGATASEAQFEKVDEEWCRKVRTLEFD